MTESPQDQNRRETYRLEPPPVMQPIVHVIFDSQRVAADNVVDVTKGGARLEFEDMRLAGLVPGQTVTASVQAPGLDGCADIPSRVVFSAIRTGRQIVGLVFTETPDLSDRVTSAFFSIFNRRELRRQSGSDRERLVSARLIASEGSPDPVDVEVVNHSSKGMAFIVDKHTDSLLRGRNTVPLAVTLPDSTEQTTVELRICHRAMRPNAVYYGGVFS